MRRGGVAIVLAWVLFPALVLADVDLGYVSFDNLIPGSPGIPGVNGFTIANLTGDPSSGGNDLPPQFPVFTSVTFLNSSLEWFSGSSSQTVSLGDLGPGFYNPTPLQFPDTQAFSSALFTATLDTTAFQLDPSVGGGTVTSISGEISVSLLPSIGNTLTAGTDFALIMVPTQATPVPEPRTFILICGLLLGIAIIRHRSSRAVHQA